MLRARTIVGLILAVLMAGFGVAFAQGVQTGVLTGEVRSSDGASLPGVTVAVSSPSLQGERTTSAGDNGGYIFKGLPVGHYTVRFNLSGMGPVEKSATVGVGDTVYLNVTMNVATVQEKVEVTAAAPSEISTSQGTTTYTLTEVDALATPRTLAGIAELAPGLTDNTPNAAQVTISGAFAYDNVFMIDGVDVDDNIFGSPQDLFIEDAIQETTVLTSGISAEYGRFSGGVINAITKRGGNDFSGSFRSHLTNPSWRDETPFEVEQGTTRESKLSKFFEATLGGPILRDRLWFFAAGRRERSSTVDALLETGISATSNTRNERFEGKLTGTLHPNHTVSATMIDNRRTETVPSIDLSYSGTPNTYVTRRLPNRLWVGNYSGVLSPNLFLEAQYSRRTFSFLDAGGTSSDIHDSPFLSPGIVSPPLIHYNAPYFDATDPEDRNNQQLTGNLSYYLSTGSFGRHDIKVGVERFRSTNIGGNSQSPTDFVFLADYKTTAGGDPIVDANQNLIPVFLPGATFVQDWLATRGARIDVDTTSAFVNDAWALGHHWSFNLGLRYEKVRSHATGDIVGVDTDTVVPRLGLVYDVSGDGKYKLSASYAHYAGKYSEAQFGRNTNVANPALLFGVYTGPAGEGRTFAPGFDPRNYRIVEGVFPTANVFFDQGLHSPVTREFTLSAGTQLGSEGFARILYTNRDVHNFVEDFIDLQTGFTDVVRNGVDYGEFQNVVYRNTDLPQRKYQGLQLQTRYRVGRHMLLDGSYTLQLKNEGNFEGENANQPAIPSTLGDYPEILPGARYFPTGRINDFQRHKLRLWSTYDLGLGRLGDLNLGLLWRYDSALTYSLVATGVDLTDAQTARAEGLGYASLPGTQNLFFDARGTQDFKGAHLFDLALNYGIPVYKKLQPWVKLSVFNILNNQKLTSWNTTITPDFTAPVDSLGLPSVYIKDPNFGKARNNRSFPVPREIQVDVGFRF